jgi:hypothetical protein
VPLYTGLYDLAAPALVNEDCIDEKGIKLQSWSPTKEVRTGGDALETTDSRTLASAGPGCSVLSEA